MTTAQKIQIRGLAREALENATEPNIDSIVADTFSGLGDDEILAVAEFGWHELIREQMRRLHSRTPDNFSPGWAGVRASMDDGSLADWSMSILDRPYPVVGKTLGNCDLDDLDMIVLQYEDQAKSSTTEA